MTNALKQEIEKIAKLSTNNDCKIMSAHMNIQVTGYEILQKHTDNFFAKPGWLSVFCIALFIIYSFFVYWMIPTYTTRTENSSDSNKTVVNKYTSNSIAKTNVNGANVNGANVNSPDVNSAKNLANEGNIQPNSNTLSESNNEPTKVGNKSAEADFKFAQLNTEIRQEVISNITVASIIFGSFIVIIAFLNLFWRSRILNQLEELNEQWAINQRYLLANSLCDSLEATHKQKALSKIIESLVSENKNEDSNKLKAKQNGIDSVTVSAK